MTWTSLPNLDEAVGNDNNPRHFLANFSSSFLNLSLFLSIGYHLQAVKPSVKSLVVSQNLSRHQSHCHRHGHLPMADNYNSDEGDFVLPINRFEGIGKQGVDTITDAAREIRGESKIRFKQLNKDDVGALSTQLNRAQWRST